MRNGAGGTVRTRQFQPLKLQLQFDCRGGAMGDIRHGARHQVRSGSSKRCFSLLEKNMKGKCIGKAMPGLQKGQVALGLSDLSWGLTVGVSTQLCLGTRDPRVRRPKVQYSLVFALGLNRSSLSMLLIMGR